MKQSSGTLLYRPAAHGWEVLLVCPAGPSARYGWSIPKGQLDAGEDLETAARRETREETGFAAGELTYLGSIDYRKSRKRVHCYAGPAPEGELSFASWEIAEARFVSLDEARRLLHLDQRPLIDLLEEHLRARQGA